jgi:hypothetical protein
MSPERCVVLPSMQDPHRLFPTMAPVDRVLDTHALEQSDWWDAMEVWETSPPSEGGTTGCLPAPGGSTEQRAGPGERWPRVTARET